MTITVITAAWRVEGLKNIIRCLSEQEYQNFEHIIVNDNNPDIRQFLVENNYFQEQDNRHVIDNRVRLHYYGGPGRNIGVQASFVYIAEKMRSDDEWICFMDDDNEFYPDYLSTFVSMHEQRPEATLLGVDMFIKSKFNSDYKKYKPCGIFPDRCDLGGFCYKRELFDKYGFFQPRPSRKITWDYELIEKMAKGEGENVYMLPKATWAFYSRKKFDEKTI